MQATLSTHERSELVALLRELDPTAPREKRRSPRRKTLINLAIQKLGPRGSKRVLTRATLVNVSVNGVGILAKIPCFQGESFVIPLRFEEGGGWLVLCQVKNSRRLESGHFKIGACFIDRIEDPQGDAKIPGDWLTP